ncbi:MAG: hypothetical protein KDA21_11570, partial [Phycisphaerales bacterium]|nr:hypothetical protein [Phycisphaerales bacterium]
MNDHPEQESAAGRGNDTESSSPSPAPQPVEATAPQRVAPPGQPLAQQAPEELSGSDQAEIAKAMESATADTSAAPRKAIHGPRVIEGGREHRHGVVVSVGPDDIFIEFGPKELGVLDRAQFKKPASAGGTDSEEGLPNPGDQIEVVIQRYEASESLYICVLPGTVQKADWE